MIEPTNVPCARCGAPMREVTYTHAHLAADVEMSCEYCGARELLPADQPQRVLAMRSLLLERRWAQDAATGPALTYLKVMERSGQFVAPYVFGLVMVVATVLLGSHASLRSVGVPLGIVGGAALATYAAFLVARGRLRATLGPLIRSFPGSPGRPRRCRRCGGELPVAAGAFVECVYCRAANLSSRDAAVGDAQRLRGDTDRAQLYAAATAARVEVAGRFVARLFTVAALAGMGLGGLIGSTLATYA